MDVLSLHTFPPMTDAAGPSSTDLAASVISDPSTFHVDVEMAVMSPQPPSQEMATMSSDMLALPKRRAPKRKAPANDAMDLSAEDARRVAETEGLTLIEKRDTQTGFLYVYLWAVGQGGEEMEGEAVANSTPGEMGDTHVLDMPAVNSGSSVDAGSLVYAGSSSAAPLEAAAAAAAEEATCGGDGVGGTLSLSTVLLPGGKATGVTRRFQLQPQKGQSMGYYRSAEGAALAYARLIGKEASAAKAKAVSAKASLPQSSILAELCDVSAEDALRMAEAEGLTLVKSTRGRAGYKHVAAFAPSMKGNKRFRLNAQAGTTSLEGNFRTAEAAALAHARQIGPEASAAEAASEQRRASGMLKISADVRISDVQMANRDEALRIAAEEGLLERIEALRSAKKSKSGFKHVTWHCDGPKHKTTKKSRPFQLVKPAGGVRNKEKSVGYFASAEAAALVQARIQVVEEREKEAQQQHGDGGGEQEAGQRQGQQQQQQQEESPPRARAPLQQVVDTLEGGSIAGGTGEAPPPRPPPLQQPAAPPTPDGGAAADHPGPSALVAPIDAPIGTCTAGGNAPLD
jgi:hypothetical protein